MDYNIKIPIIESDDNSYKCICKYCSNPNRYLKYYDGYSYLYNYCLLCKAIIWYYHQICSLYGRRSPYVVCFNCRIPYYEKGYTNGQIYTIAKQSVQKN